MNKLIVVFSLLLLVSCSRYNYIPRAKEQNKIVLQNTDSKPTIETAIVEQNLETLKTADQKEKVSLLKIEPDISCNIEISQGNKENIYPKTILKKQITVDTIPKEQAVSDKKYKTLQKLILESLVLTFIGVILAINAYILGYLLIGLGIFLLLIFLVGLIITFLLDKLGKKKAKNQKKPIPNKEPKEVKEKTKTKKKFDKVNYIFINLLICNFIVWLIGNTKIKK